MGRGRGTRDLQSFTEWLQERGGAIRGCVTTLLASAFSLIQQCASSPFPNRRPPPSQTPAANTQSSAHVSPCDSCRSLLMFHPISTRSQACPVMSPLDPPPTQQLHSLCSTVCAVCTPSRHSFHLRIYRIHDEAGLAWQCLRPLHTSYITRCLAHSRRASQKSQNSRTRPHTGPVPAVSVPAAVPQICEVVWSHTLVL